MKLSSEVRAVTLDVGGTLIEPWPSVGHVYAQVAADFGLMAVGVDTLNARFVQAWRARADFDYSRAAWHRVVQASFGHVAISPECFTAMYQRFAEAEAWRIYDDVRPALEELRRHGIRLGVISNWDERLRPLLAALGLAEFFEVVVASHDIGRAKPAPELFGHAARALALPPGAVLHVGDSRREDVAGAESAGFQALLLARAGEGGEVVGAAPGALRDLGALVDALSSRARGLKD